MNDDQKELIRSAEMYFNITYPQEYNQMLISHDIYIRKNFRLNNKVKTIVRILSPNKENEGNIYFFYEKINFIFEYNESNPKIKLIPFAESTFGCLICFGFNSINLNPEIIFFDVKKAFYENNYDGDIICSNLSEFTDMIYKSDEKITEWYTGDTAVTNKMLVNAEDEFGVSFPEKYKLLLIKHGDGTPFPNNFYVNKQERVFERYLPLIGGEFNMTDAFDALKDQWHTEFFSMIPFAEDPFGNFICFDYSAGSENPEIIFVDMERLYEDINYKGDFISPNFNRFIMSFH